MLEVQQEISLAHHQQMLGTTYDVLVEGIAKIDPNYQARMMAQAAHNDLLQIGGGLQSSISTFTEDVRLTARTRGDHIVAFDGSADLIGQIVPVKVTDAASLSLKGTLAL